MASPRRFCRPWPAEAELKVIGRGSSFHFRGPEKAAAHIARALKATHVLDGSVRRSGNKVRIAANLIECDGETTVWSERFDREVSDIFALQDEIAEAVAAALKVAFAPALQAESIDPTAYTLYLKALEIRNRGLLAPATGTAVIELLEEGDAPRAPKFARAWECLATMKAARFRFDDSEQPQTVERSGGRRRGRDSAQTRSWLGRRPSGVGSVGAPGPFRRA